MNLLNRYFCLVLVCALGFAGCTNQQSAKVDPTPAADTDAHVEEHAHETGAHGGMIIAIGRESYHAEIVFDTGGVVRLFMLQADESKIQEVPQQTFNAFVKAQSELETTTIEFRSEQQDGDSEGQTSQFVAQLPENLTGQPIDVTIPNLKIGDDRFRIGFSTPEMPEHSMMPAAASSAEAQELYLEPGGIYTQADIDANGRVTATQKFKGFMSAHDMNPKPGDKICPVTFTKANAKCVWIVGGKSYEFCCPPCVDEFLRLAKEDPDQIKDPSDYVKQ